MLKSKIPDVHINSGRNSQISDGFITKTDESLPNLHGKDEPTNSMIFGSSDQGPDQFS